MVERRWFAEIVPKTKRTSTETVVVLEAVRRTAEVQGADKGVLTTCGDISRAARDAAKQARGRVVLIDGEQLVLELLVRGDGDRATEQDAKRRRWHDEEVQRD